MQELEIGKIYTGKVKGITQYGAFIDIDGGGTGMVHISEIANTYVSDIREHLTENQEVKVKVIGINEAERSVFPLKKLSIIRIRLSRNTDVRMTAVRIVRSPISGSRKSKRLFQNCLSRI